MSSSLLSRSYMSSLGNLARRNLLLPLCEANDATEFGSGEGFEAIGDSETVGKGERNAGGGN